MDAQVRRGAVLVRAILAYAAAVNLLIGLWATVSPRGFYDDFPGFGQVWVAVDGPFNEHLLRDVGSWSLALGLLCVVAAWRLERTLVATAGVALAAQSLLHGQYHLANPVDSLSGAEQLASTGGILVLVVLGAGVAAWAWRSPTAGPA